MTKVGFSSLNCDVGYKRDKILIIITKSFSVCSNGDSNKKNELMEIMNVNPNIQL